MKKIICVCNTYFQLLVTIQLKLTLFSEDEVILVLSDHSNNVEKVHQRLQSMSLFKQCHYIETKKAVLEKGITLRKLIQFSCYITGNDRLWKKMNLEEQDEIIFYNQTNEIYTLFAHLYKKNPNLKVSRFEEGILSYNNNLFPKQKAAIANVIRHMIGAKTLEDLYHNFYCFYPEVYTGEMTVVKVPEIENDGEIGRVLSQCFEVSIPNEAYNSKYIYFSSVYDMEGEKPIGELQLVKQIAELVGKDNLLVKVHPRDDVSRFEKEGLRVDKNSNVPWEVIQLGRDFSKHVFLTINSTSVMSVSLLQEASPKIIYMFKLCDIEGNSSAVKTVEEINRVVTSEFMKENMSTIFVAETINEILN